MNKYAITFTEEATGQTRHITVKATGIIPASEEAIRQAIGKAWSVGRFWIPTACTQL